MGLGFRALLEEGTSEQSLSRLQSGGLSGSRGRSSKAHARLNFLELRKAEVQLSRIHLPRTSVNKGKEERRGRSERPSGPGGTRRATVPGPPVCPDRRLHRGA